jgi:hypothetical protein
MMKGRKEGEKDERREWGMTAILQFFGHEHGRGEFFGVKECFLFADRCQDQFRESSHNHLTTVAVVTT